jgi:hypothetical protein
VILVQKFNSKSLVLWLGNWSSFIGVDVKVLRGIDQSKVFGTLSNQMSNVLEVEYKWGSPVHDVVDVALRCCADDKVIVLQGHDKNSVSEIKIFIHFM